MRADPSAPPANAVAHAHGGAGSFRSLPIGVWLALALAAVLIALLAGHLLAQSSTRETTRNIARVEQRHEPFVRLARELEQSVGAFERAVLGYLKFDNSETRQAVTDASQDVVSALAEYQRLGALYETDVGGSSLRDPIAEFHRDGLLLVEAQRRRRAAVADYWAAVDSIRRLIFSAGAVGLETGEDVVFARRSLNELARAITSVRDSAAAQFSHTRAGAAEAARRDEERFRSLIQRYASELTRSPGAVWVELIESDLERASHQRREVARLDSELEESRRHFAEAAASLQRRIQDRLHEPAWQALAQAARLARQTAEQTERTNRWISLTVVLVVLAISCAVAYGVTVPVRRLTQGTRELASGALATRVPRGGVRELDELAQAFNHMAERLAASEQTVRNYQQQLERRVAERTRQLRHLAHHDPLTDLPNRRQLFSFLIAAIERSRAAGRRLAVLFIDLDNFKTINDSLGHQFGDAVLCEVASRLRACFPPGNFISRFGGDEFTLVLTDEAAANAEECAARLIAEFQRPLTVESRELLVGVSIGIAICPDHGSDAESLLRAADSALFRAKELGRNRFSVHSPDLLHAATTRFRTEQALRKAVEAGELVLYFQPIVSLDTLRTTAAEALLRWQRADGSIVAAADFLSVAEQSGLLLELNDWVLERTGRVLREWRCDRWPDARVAVNVSAHQFLAGNFVSTVERLLREADLPPDCLELELSETVLQTGGATIDALHSLRLLGITIALDDFGTGFSSLTSLEQLPLDRVKLDRSLIADVDCNPRAAAIARSIVGLCRSLGLQVTAEGVERRAQLDFLRGCGDVDVQGYLVARPVPADELIDIVHGGYPNLRADGRSDRPKVAQWNRRAPRVG